MGRVHTTHPIQSRKLSVVAALEAGREVLPDELPVDANVVARRHEGAVVVELQEVLGVVLAREVMERLAERLCAPFGEVEVQRIGPLPLQRRERRIVEDDQDAEGLAEGSVEAVAFVDDDEMVVSGGVFRGSWESTLRIEVLHRRESVSNLADDLRFGCMSGRCDANAEGHKDGGDESAANSLAASTLGIGL